MSRLPYSSTERDRIDAQLNVLSQLLATLRGDIPTPSLLVGATWLDVKLGYGAAGDGSADDRTAITSALTAAATAVNAGLGNVYVFFPAGTYNVSRSGSSAWSIDCPSGVTLLGVRGQSWLRHPTGMPNASVAVMRINNCSDVTVDGLGIDGNWGVAVGVDDDKLGHNHTTQTDPKNYGIHVRGGTNITIKHCKFRQTYGDAIGIASSTNSTPIFKTGAIGVRVLHCDIDVCARSGISLVQKCRDVLIDGCRITNVFATPIDFEPIDQPVRNVVVRGNYIQGWWNPSNTGRSANIAVSIQGGKTGVPDDGNFVRNVRLHDNTLVGGLLISDAVDIRAENNRIVCDWDNYSYAPVYVQQYCDDVIVRGNYIYDRTTVAPGAGRAHQGAIQVQYYGSGSQNVQPAGVRVCDNEVHARNGRYGIVVEGTGQYAFSSGAQQLGETSTATSVTYTTLVRTGAGWTVNQWNGYRVRIGAAWATVQSNTSDTLTLDVEGSYTSAWRTPLGDDITTPSAGVYIIFMPGGIVDVHDNRIECTNDGRGGGASGIYVYASRAGMRVRVWRNEIKNAGTNGIEIESVDADRAFRHLDVSDNFIWDDQLTPTTTNAVKFTGTPQYDKLVLRGNSIGTGVTNATSGLTTGRWLIKDGDSQEWEGFGAPAFTATKGSRYYRKDGGANTTLYINETGNSTWRAV